MVLFLEYPPCSTCKKAKKWLDDHGVSYEARHIKEQNPTASELKEWYEKSGLELKKFFNTSGMKYKELGLKDKRSQHERGGKAGASRHRRNAGKASAGDRGRLCSGRI